MKYILILCLALLVGCRDFIEQTNLMKCVSCKDTSQVYRLVTYSYRLATYSSGQSQFLEHAIEIQTVRNTDTLYIEINYKDLK